MKRQATALMLGLAFSASALAQYATATPTVTVLPDRYIFAGRVYQDLGRLEDAVRATRPASLALDACGPETRALMAASHRFRDLPIRIRPLSLSEDAACSPPALVPVRMPASAGPTGIDDRAVTEYWLELAP